MRIWIRKKRFCVSTVLGLITVLLLAGVGRIVAQDFLILPLWSQGKVYQSEGGIDDVLWSSGFLFGNRNGEEGELLDLGFSLEMDESALHLEAEMLLEDEDVLSDFKVERYLYDRGFTLVEAQREIFSEVLQRHAKESEISVYVIVSPRGSSQSAAQALEALLKAIPAERVACAVSYILQEPHRSEIKLSRAALERYSLPRAPASLEGVALRVAELSDPIDQLDHYLLQLSSDLFWIEKEAVYSPEGLLTGAQSNEQKRAVQERKRRAEDHVGELLPEKASLSSPAWWAWGSLPLLALLGGGWYWKKRQERPELYFPVSAYTTRLQAPYCGGSSLEVNFKDNSLR